jgi:hypothetical protein
MALTLTLLVPSSVLRAQSGGPSANVSVFVSGLDEPRGLTFGPDGNLYLAEAGHGGTFVATGLPLTSFGRCIPAAPEWPAFTGGYNGKIDQINSTGQVTPIVSNLPSGISNGLAIGAADLKFSNGVLYGLLVGGCDSGNRDVPSGILQIDPLFGTWSEYNLSTWLQNHPAANPDPDDMAPDGSWYAMTAVNGKLYTVNPNAGQMVQLDPNTATISEVVDTSVFTKTWAGPTAMTNHNGNFYTCTLGKFPQTPGQQEVLQITPSGTVSVYASGLTGCVGLAWDAQGNLYALESFTGGAPAPGAGQVVKVNTSGAPTTAASGLSFPTAMTFGPDGMLYVSNVGYGAPGKGQIVKVNVSGTM